MVVEPPDQEPPAQLKQVGLVLTAEPVSALRVVLEVQVVQLECSNCFEVSRVVYRARVVCLLISC